MAVTQTPKVVYYPESDGKPMAETPEHLDAMLYLIGALQTYFARRPDVYVGGNQFMYWIEGNPNHRVAPDVYVGFGIAKTPPRPVWKVWEEGKAPDVIMEVTSQSTSQEDLGKKYRLYERLGVKEYFLVDITREYLSEPLILYRLQGTEFVRVPSEQPAEQEWRVYSEQLGLYVVVRWEDGRYRARLYDPAQGRYLPRVDEAVTAYNEAVAAYNEAVAAYQEQVRLNRELQQQLQEEARRVEEEAHARAEAEQRLRELEEELRRLKGQEPQ